MTGFGKGTAEVRDKKVIVELKSLNSKQMDITARVPSSIREMEVELRNEVGRLLERGKVDLLVTIETLTGEVPVRINLPVLRTYKAQIEAMSAELGIEQPEDWYSTLLRLPDAIVTESGDEVSEEMREGVMRALHMATECLTAHRRAEGEKLEEFFGERIKAIGELLGEIEKYEVERVPHIRARIEEGLSKISVAEYDMGRLEQEMIFYIEKLDINEERQRLGQHLRYFLDTMSGSAGQGKKLGFIAQEMGREINTMGSKSNQADMQCIVVKMKDLLEQIKEQVLNVL